MSGGVEVLTADAAEGAQARAAGALLSAGCREGDRVVFCLGSSAALLCAVLGALRVGIVPVLLNATLTDEERDVLVDDADPTLVVTTPDALARLDSGPPTSLAPHPRCRPMHYTSGTTGRAKGVWTGLWDAATAAAALADEADLWSFGPDDVHLVCSPMYHSVSIRFAGGTLLAGGTCVVLDQFDAGRAAAVLEGDHGPTPTTTFLAPAALTRLLALPDTGPDRFGALRLLVHAGSPCPPALKRVALELTGPGVVWEFYGSTEGQFTVCPPDEWLERPGTVGRARPGRRVTVDADGTVWCRPPAFGRFAYWRDKAKTAAAWRGGAFSVGDLGRLDDDGYLFLDGRRDDLVITGGVNVYPAEVEAALSDVPGVEEVAVFALPDERWGQRVCAVVVPVPGADAGRVLAAVSDHAVAHLAGYKRPKQYEVASGLPRTATGKVRRLELPARLGLE
jgi:long-chain acyl-CoA synthetase